MVWFLQCDECSDPVQFKEPPPLGQPVLCPFCNGTPPKMRVIELKTLCGHPGCPDLVHESGYCYIHSGGPGP